MEEKFKDTEHTNKWGVYEMINSGKPKILVTFDSMEEANQHARIAFKLLNSSDQIVEDQIGEPYSGFW